MATIEFEDIGLLISWDGPYIHSYITKINISNQKSSTAFIL